MLPGATQKTFNFINSPADSIIVYLFSCHSEHPVVLVRHLGMFFTMFSVILGEIARSQKSPERSSATSSIGT